ncbi:hypothetical protein BJ165DRAFT_1534016 [Panaeolus papilionaceus]|nr:hypothetical protein BJ165DRAFT_1534016 [Panaeolus papilionaceus]
MSLPTPSIVNARSRYPARPLQLQNLNAPSVVAMPTDPTKSGLGPIRVSHPTPDSQSSIATIAAAISRRPLSAALVEPSLSAVPTQIYAPVPTQPYLYATPVEPFLSAVPAQPSPFGNPVHNPSAVAVDSLGATTPNTPILGVVAGANLQHLQTQGSMTHTSSNTLVIPHGLPTDALIANASLATTATPTPAQAPVEDMDDHTDNIEDDNFEDDNEEGHSDLNQKIKEFRRVIAAQRHMSSSCEISQLHAIGTGPIPSMAFLDDVPDDSIPRPAKRASYMLQKSMGLEGNAKIYNAMRAVVRGCMSHCAENYKTVWLKQDREYVMTVVNVVRSRCLEFRHYQGGWPIEASDPLGLKKKVQAQARLQAKAVELVQKGGLEALGIAGLAGPVPQAVGVTQVNQVNELDTGVPVGEETHTEEAPASEELPAHLLLAHVTQPTLHHIHPVCPAPYVETA